MFGGADQLEQLLKIGHLEPNPERGANSLAPQGRYADRSKLEGFIPALNSTSRRESRVHMDEQEQRELQQKHKDETSAMFRRVLVMGGCQAGGTVCYFSRLCLLVSCTHKQPTKNNIHSGFQRLAFGAMREACPSGEDKCRQASIYPLANSPASPRLISSRLSCKP